MKHANRNLRTLVGAAMLSAVAFVLQFLEFPVPLSPSFAKMDLSDLPALIGAFAYGPLWGVVIEAVKNALHLFQHHHSHFVAQLYQLRIRHVMTRTNRIATHLLQHRYLVTQRILMHRGTQGT